MHGCHKTFVRLVRDLDSRSREIAPSSLFFGKGLAASLDRGHRVSGSAYGGRKFVTDGAGTLPQRKSKKFQAEKRTPSDHGQGRALEWETVVKVNASSVGPANVAQKEPVPYVLQNIQEKQAQTVK